MARLPRRKSLSFGLASQLTALPFLSRNQRQPYQKKASRPRITRLHLEPLEERTLLSASISGNIVNTLTGAGLAAQVVYLTKGQTGAFNTTVTDAAPTIGADTLPGNLLNILPPGSAASALQVQGVPSKITDLAVNMDVSLDAGASGPVTVALVSPTGLIVPDLPNLFNLQPGEHFVGTFDGNGATDFTLAESTASATTTGVFRPQQYFTDPQAHIYDGSPNGTWGLVFIGDTSTLKLNSWSLNFTAPNVSATTDVNGNYSFTGLLPDNYTVSASADVTTPQSQAVPLADGQDAAANFTVQPEPDLMGVAFNIVNTTATTATIQYTLTNQGNGDANPFDVDVLLSADGVIRDNVAPLTTISIDKGLAAHASTSGTFTVNLPAKTPASDYVGFVIKSPQGQTEGNSANNSNQGAGIDLALLGGNVNQNLTAGAGAADVSPHSPAAETQQQPSIAVDPNNPDHIVVAYMDYDYQVGHVFTGYAGVGIRYSTDGGQNWTDSSIALPAGFDQGASQPVAHFDNNGHIYVVFAAATFLGAKPGLTTPTSSQRQDGFTSDNGIFVTAGDFTTVNHVTTLNWAAPVAVTENLYSGTAVPFDIIPDLAVDTTPTSPNYGNLYVTWARFYPAGQFPGDPSSTAGSDVFIAASKDGGASWTTELQGATDPAPGRSVLLDPQFGTNGTGLPGRGFVTYPHLTVGPAGDVYVAAYAGGFFVVFHSSDGGATFAAPDYNNQLGLPFGAGNLTLPNGTLFTDSFRTLPVRDIVADPTHPGRIYVAEANEVNDSSVGGVIDAGTIVFAVSDDNGLTWRHMFTVGANATNFADLTPAQRETFLPTLNDDDNGNSLTSAAAAQLNNEVISGQALPSLAVDAQGNLTVIWYDARTDPSGNTGNPGQQLAVFGTVSTDGGNTFSSNFEVSNQSFDPNAGAFKDGSGHTDSFLGDHIDVVAVNGVAYAVWTGTSSTGKQDIYFDKYNITPAPQAPADRYSPNNTIALATNLGTVTAQQVYPLLKLLPGGADEYFTLTAGAQGKLTVFVSAASGFSNLNVEVDSNGVAQTPVGARPVYDDSGAVVIGEEFDFNANSNQVFFIHVSSKAETATTYTLAVGTLTADLGTQVQGTVASPVAPGQQFIYRLAAGVGGTLQVTLNADANNSAPLILSVLGSDGHTVLYTDPLVGVLPGMSEQFTVTVTQGQVVFIEVSGAFLPANGNFTLQYTNFDQYESTGPKLVDSLQDTVAQAPAGANLFDNAGNFGPPDKPNEYRVVALTSGTLQVTITGSGGYTGDLRFAFFAADGVTFLKSDKGINSPSGVMSGQSETVSISVTQGETLVLVVSGARLTSSSGSYTLQYSNFDPAQTAGPSTLFIPTVGDPSSIVAAMLPGDKTPSLLTTNTDATDSLSVLKSNGDGTFQAPQEYDVGPGLSGSLTAGTRQIAVADLTGQGAQDVIVPNFRAADVSVLLGDGAGGFQPQRTFDATASPDALVTGDFGNGHTDVAVLENFPQLGGVSKLAILLGRGDGTFAPAALYATAFGNGANSMITGNFSGHGHLDVIVFSKNQPQAEIFVGNGDGTFQAGRLFDIGENTFNAKAVELNGDSHLDLITTSTNSGNVYVQLGNGDGTFQAPVAFSAMSAQAAGQVGVFGLAVANFPVPADAPLPAAGLQFGTKGIVVTAQARSGQGAAQVILLPELLDSNGNYAGYGAPIVLANVGTAGNIAVGNFGSGGVDLAVADKGGVTIIYSQPLTLPPSTAATPRALGNADHVVTPTQAIVAGNEDAFYTYTVPKEAVSGSSDQVIDVSALMQYVGGAGLQLDVLDKTTGKDLKSGQFLANQSGSGVRFQVVAAQGDVLQVHVSGLSGTVAGFGAYTLDIDVLPQVVSIQAESALPGSPVTSLVLTLQGDKPDVATAQDPNNYVITWLDGNQVIPPADYSVIYNPGANTNIASGLTYPTAVRHTITLTFSSPLSVGSYEITVKPNVLAASFSASEAGLLVPDAALGGHLLVSTKNGVIHNGSDFVVPNLVTAAGTPDPTSISGGTSFLTQLQNDLSALLDRSLKNGMSDAAITDAINAEIYARFIAGISSSETVAIIWLDPVSIGLQSPTGGQDAYSLATNTASNGISQSYISVGGNVEVVVLAGLTGTFNLDVKNVPQQARGGEVVIDSLNSASNLVKGFTDNLRSDLTNFTVNILPAAVVGSGQTIGNTPGQIISTLNTGSASQGGSTVAGSNAVASTVQAGSAILIGALLSGFPSSPSAGTASLGGNGAPTGTGNGSTGSTQNSSTGSTGANASSSGGGGDDAGTSGRSPMMQGMIDNLFSNLPDSVGGYVDLADGWVEDGENAAKTLAERINAFLKNHQPPAPPMGTPPECLQTPPPSNGPGGNETSKPGESKIDSPFGPVAGAMLVEESHWRTNEYGLTLFLASGLYYVGMRDLAADDESRSRKKRR